MLEWMQPIGMVVCGVILIYLAYSIAKRTKNIARIESQLTVLKRERAKMLDLADE